MLIFFNTTRVFNSPLLHSWHFPYPRNRHADSSLSQPPPPSRAYRPYVSPPYFRRDRSPSSVFLLYTRYSPHFFALCRSYLHLSRSSLGGDFSPCLELLFIVMNILYATPTLLSANFILLMTRDLSTVRIVSFSVHDMWPECCRLERQMSCRWRTLIPAIEI